jgi:hypothetical protein
MLACQKLHSVRLHDIMTALFTSMRDETGVGVCRERAEPVAVDTKVSTPSALLVPLPVPPFFCTNIIQGCPVYFEHTTVHCQSSRRSVDIRRLVVANLDNFSNAVNP